MSTQTTTQTKQCVLGFLGPDRNVHIFKDTTNKPFIFDTGMALVLKNFAEVCAVYEVSATSLVLLKGLGYREDFPERYTLSRGEYRDFF